jgi:hypothetical protein
VIRLRCPGPEPLAAILASCGWVALWVAVAALVGSWWWLLLGEGLHLVVSGWVVWWYARVKAEVEATTAGLRRVG